jgi:hypothetical protein
MSWFLCPYLGHSVELTEERREHIAERHPDILPEYESQLAEAIAAPDSIYKSQYDDKALIFSKWFDNIKTGRYLVAVVVTPEVQNQDRA